ncbi:MULTISPECIES: hypothetical protein [Okeania]|uniref:hypothetical protein n=1 Tax=Okeania TaxID=1458928 RepID=UPI000F53DB87|nr:MULTISPECIES: hypothetical protein [Okeania]NET17278.1 hypothetical protein [Okeania sp. SIO1H6]NES79152.1 hypothetical protein [Okeania sp. SIO1H4]NES90499.1 hypothetical protein [Okeania sp. SIO2B9]NET23346.1 hypothetical protein [Okeania sp. SIO1H5]NET79588.1 hypothetical protein [Okeania sp. SIO1F9]
MATNEEQMIGGSEYLKRTMGISSAPFEAYLNYGYALLAIAGADGDVPEAEMNWLINHQRMVGAPEEAIEKYKEFDYKNAKLEDLLPKIKTDVPNWSAPRTLLYHAIKMSRADKDYAKQEEEAVKKAAKLLGVADDITLSLNILVEMEEKVESMLKALIHTETL